MKLTLLYRGPLSSCNYGCDYCPFAKRRESRAELQTDADALTRFVDWVAARPPQDELRVFFTPWGEALIRRGYQRALARLTTLPQVRRAAIQTNLSAPLSWVEDCDPTRLGIWATWHPEWTPLESFAGKIRELHQRGVSVSAGAVGLARLLPEIERLRAALPPEVYLWINAAKRLESYDEARIARFEAIDPHFRSNTVQHPSLGRSCRTGESVVSVSGDGTVRRCHFVPTPIANLYAPDFEAALRPRLCSNQSCGCHIGYVHLDYLGLGALYGEGLLERVPAARSSQP